ncbi:hypothetical protein NLI96_g4809 [Meripilus lineatus]|uniref:Uncharacterized protein n=1 Tax=Meripilus lineatus TaxID=2056292 RepID=A0AAD5YEG4_9APHY|nr:hypothetical protein NLI96_g4809 [Physisporinus lineatus]
MLVLEQPNDVVESVCWEWRRTENGAGQWFLTCCIDEIGSLKNSTYICFLLGSHTSISVHEFHRVVGIQISIEKQAGFAMDPLDTLLCEFQVLETLHINFVEPLTNCSSNSIVRHLPKLRKKIEGQGLNSLHGWAMALSEHAPKCVCVETKTHRGTKIYMIFDVFPFMSKFTGVSRKLILYSLYRIKDDLVTNGLEEMSKKAWGGILKAQRELVLVDPAKYQLSLLETLDSMADVTQRIGKTEEAGATVHTLHLVNDLDKIFTYLSSLGCAEEAVEYCCEAVEAVKLLVARQSIDKHFPRFAETLNHIFSLLPKIRPEEGMIPSGRHNSADLGRLRTQIDYCQREIVGILRNLAGQDAKKYTPHLTQALNRMADDLYGRGRDEEATTCQIKAAQSWRELATQDAASTPASVDALENLAVSIFRRGRNQVIVDHGWKTIDFTIPTQEDRLARALSHMAHSLFHRGYYAEALDHRRQTVAFWRKLAAQGTNKCTVHLARALGDAAISLIETCHRTEAIEYQREAVDLWRKLSDESSIYTLDFTGALHDLAATLSQNQLLTEAVYYRREVVDVWRKLYIGDSIHALAFEAPSRILPRLFLRTTSTQSPSSINVREWKFFVHSSSPRKAQNMLMVLQQLLRVLPVLSPRSNSVQRQ